MDLLRQQVQDLAQQLNSRRPQKRYSLKDICPYPFDKSIVMPPFSCNFRMPKFDRSRGHQDLIDQESIIVDTNKGLTNANHAIFKEPFVKHDKGKASTSGTQNNTANFRKVSYDYTIDAISAGDAVVDTITINPGDKNDGLTDEDKQIGPNSWRDDYDNHVCMMSEAP